MIETIEERYRLETVRFRYQLGEVQWAERAVPVAVDTSLFFDRPVDAGSFVPPVEVLRFGVSCVMVLSQPLASPLPLVASAGPFVRFAPHQYRRSTIRLEGSFDDYLTAMPAERRRKLLAKKRKFREACAGSLALRVSSTEGELEAFQRTALPLAANTYQERLFKKGLPNTDAFHTDLRERARTGRARGYLLDGPNGKPIAYIYATLDGPLVTFEHLGYDLAYSKLSPGVVLQIAVLEDLFRARCAKIFDFGEGEGQHKTTFGSESTACGDLYFFPKTARGLELFAGQALAHTVSRAAVRALSRLGLREKVKRLMRRRFAAT